jgi:ATPase family associated with various cellular activities (AAA)
MVLAAVFVTSPVSYTMSLSLLPSAFAASVHVWVCASPIGKFLPDLVKELGAVVVIRASRCPVPSTEARTLRTASPMPIPLLVRSDQEWFSEEVNGSLTLFVGPSGSGKTTAFQLALSGRDRPCIFINGRKQPDVWAALGHACGVFDGAAGRGTIEAAFEHLRRDGVKTPTIFIDDVHALFGSDPAMGPFATWLLEMQRTLISANFLSSEASAAKLFEPLAGFSKRLRTQFVRYAPINDVVAYLGNHTQLTPAQIKDVVDVTGASLLDVGIFAVTFFNKTASDEDLQRKCDNLEQCNHR